MRRGCDCGEAAALRKNLFPKSPMNPASPPLPPPAPVQNPSSVWRSELPGMLLFFLVLMGSLYAAHALREPVMRHFSLHGGSPGDAPPWYFITQDFAKGLCSGGVLLLCVLAAAFMWRRWPAHAGMLVWMSLLWLGQDVVRSWIIYRACPGLLEGRRSTSRWPTFESYLRDDGIEWGNTGVLVGAVLLSVVFSLVQVRAQRRAARRATAEKGGD